MRRLTVGLGIGFLVGISLVVLEGAASYPSSVKSFTTRNLGDVIQAAHVNDIQDEVSAIETGLLNGVQHGFKPQADNTYDLGTAALSWRDLFADRNALIGGTLGVTGAVTHTSTTTLIGAITSNLIFTDATYDIGASGATRPRDFFLSRNAVLGGSLTTVGAHLPSANDGAALGASGTAWADLFLAAGGVINFNSGNVTITHSAGALAIAAVLTVSGGGSHAFSAGHASENGLRVRNTTAGTGAYAALIVGNDTTIVQGGLYGFSASYTTSGAYIQDSVVVDSRNAGGLSLAATHASGDIRLYAGNGATATVKATGALNLIPRASAPASAASGDLYMDSTPNPDELCVYDGAAWQGISSGTDANCS